MSLIATDKGGGDYKPVPAGTHRAICTMIVDMGVQPSAKFKPSPKVYVRWELPDETMEYKGETVPMVIGKTYTHSLNEKANLRRDLENWRGRTFTDPELRSFDLRNVLGKPCLISVVHNNSGGKTYANVSQVASLPKGIDKPTTATKPLSYDIDAPDHDVFGSLPPWLQTAIKERISNDHGTTVSANGESRDDFSDDIPF